MGKKKNCSRIQTDKFLMAIKAYFHLIYCWIVHLLHNENQMNAVPFNVDSHFFRSQRLVQRSRPLRRCSKCHRPFKRTAGRSQSNPKPQTIKSQRSSQRKRKHVS